jgi:hypothetical protein
MTTIAGGEIPAYRDGVGSGAAFNTALCILATSDGASILVADASVHRIRLIDTATRAVTTIAGSGEPTNRDGVGVEAAIHLPVAMAFDEACSSAQRDSRVYIAAGRTLRCLSLTAGTSLSLHHPSSAS